jgi:hypothetical protein
VTAHPGAYCSPPGATDTTKTDTPMVCSTTKPGERARWRRNGPSPTRAPRRRARKSAAAGGTLPQVNTGIDPTKNPVPAPAAKQPTPAAETTEQRIHNAYRGLAAKPGDYVNLSDLRDNLPDIPKNDLDAALNQMLSGEHVQLEPDPVRWRIDDRARGAAVHIGGEDCNLIALGDPNAGQFPDH